MPRPIIHNRRLPESIHRVMNAVYGGALLAGLGALGLDFFAPENSLWSFSLSAVYAAPIAFLILLFVGPNRLSVVEGAAGELGNDELE